MVMYADILIGDFEQTRDCYKHEPLEAIENEGYKILWHLQSSVISIFKLDNQILSFSIKSRRNLSSQTLPYLEKKG